MADKQTSETNGAEETFAGDKKKLQQTSSDSALLDVVTSSDGTSAIRRPPPIDILNLEPVSKNKVIKAENWPSIADRKLYPMKSSPRGLALIINNEKFEDENISYRFGSKVDAKNLEGMLTELGFKVILKTNLNRNAMMDEIRKFSHNRGHLAADMCIVTVLSHGKENDQIYCTDGFTIQTDWIFSQFDNSNCKALVGKPKVFILQACRGSDRDYGITRKEMDKSSSDSDQEDEALEAGATGLAESDMLIVYSTVPGYTSLRDHDSGTWLVQSITDVFAENAKDTDIRDMLDMVSEHLANKFQSERNEVMSCTYENRNFTKKLYFNPGLNKNERSSKI